MKRALNLLILLASTFALGQTQNWVKSSVYKDDSATPATNTTINYIDGLGRPIQTIVNKQTPLGKDLVTPIVYDAYGRTFREYLPYASQADQMAFADNNTVISGLQTDYTNRFGVDGSYAFSETLYEPSPLNRPIEKTAPGNDWRKIAGSTAGHTIKTEYGFNSGTSSLDKVKLFKVNATWNATYGCYWNITLQNSTGTTYYTANTLSCTITKDENWKAASGKLNTTEEYKDTDGNILLKRTFNRDDALSITTALDTYYVYDQFGNLTYVIPPMAAMQSLTTTIIDAFCYQYRYDALNRLVEKKLPGRQWEYIVYDRLDRPVATGPALSPFGTGTYGWSITKYDVLNRPILTGWLSVGNFSATTRSTLQASAPLSSATRLSEDKSATDTTIMGIAFRYTNAAWPTASYHTLTVNYFDDYNYPGAPTTFTSIESQPVYYNNGAQKPKGLPTGSWARIVDQATGATGLYTYILYDKKGRAIRNCSINNGGYTMVDSRLDFTGKPTYTITTHRLQATSSEIYVKDSYTYDNFDRMLTHVHQLGLNGMPELLSKNEYDELGQLKSKKVGGTDLTAATYYQKVDYSYNIRGWMKGINNTASLLEAGVPKDLFAFKINYNDNPVNNNGELNVEKLYNGNISETFWRTSNDDNLRKYGYTYDNLNRLRNAVYQTPDLQNKTPHSYDESIWYDFNGNINVLERNGEFDDQNAWMQIDKLAYTYDGNRLMKVYDMSTSPSGFKDDGADNDGQRFDINNDYSYDANGNMVSDENKGILSITYNQLNLPLSILFSGDHTAITYLYDGNGKKMQKTVYTADGATTTTYMDGFQYTNNVLNYFPTAEGYVNATLNKRGELSFNYVYNYTDHLGNIRASYSKNGAGGLVLMEENNYYPFGLKHKNYNMSEQRYRELQNGSVGLDPQPVVNPSYKNYNYKYNGKELQDELGLNLYDYGARNYDPAIGRWMNIDPLAEQYRRWSPYNYCIDNPMRFVDPDGMGVDDVIITGKFKQEAFDQLKASSPNLNMTMTDGKVTATAVEGANLSEADTTLLNATTDKDITVNLVTTDKTIFPSSSGMGDLQGRPEAFGGSTVNSDGTKTATQTINTSLAEKTDTVEGQKPGTVAQHAVIEAYVGAQNSPGAGDSVTSPAAYKTAHTQTNGIQERSGMPINPAGAMLTPINPSAAPEKRGYQLVPRVGNPVILYKTGKK